MYNANSEAEIIYEILEKFTQQKYYYIISK